MATILLVRRESTMSFLAILSCMIVFSVGFVAGASWVSAKDGDMRDHENQDLAWRREPV
jgi:hypothetical protein